jgi:hypothetical protein
VIAFTIAALKFATAYNIEYASICIILAANDTISVVFNFIAVTVLSQFEAYIFFSMKASID